MKKEIDGVISIVGHVPREISLIWSSFIQQDGAIRFLITESRRYSSDLPQGGLELPCILVFTTTCTELNQITRKQLGNTLSVIVREGTLDDEKTDTGNAAADTHSRISSSDCSHQSGTGAKPAGVQIKEEQAKLPELEVDLTST